MYIKKFFHRIITLSIIISSLTFIPNDYELAQTMSVAHAEIQTYIGVGDYVLSEDVAPGDIKSKAKMYAERNALEQAGIFIESHSASVSGKLTKDEIVTIAGGILKVVNVKYEIIPLNDESGIAKYRATVEAQIDSDKLNDEIIAWRNRNSEERSKLVEQNNLLQKIIDEQQQKISELETMVTNSKTPQDNAKVNAKITEELATMDKENLYIKKLKESQDLVAQSDYYEALAVIDEAIQLNLNRAEAYACRGSVYDDLGEYSRAIEDYTKAIQINPNYAAAYNDRGVAYKNLNEHEKAIKDYSEAIRLNSNKESYYYNRGNIYYSLKNYSKAIDDYTKAIKINPNLLEAYNNRGSVYDDLKDYKKAIDDYTAALKINPNYASAYNNWAWTCYNLKDYKQALEKYTKAIECNPYNSLYYKNRGRVYQAMGNSKKAQEDFAKAKKLQQE